MPLKTTTTTTTTTLCLVVKSYEFKHYLFTSIHFYSILRTDIPGSKTPFANKLFLVFTATMVWSSFGPYHGLWCEDAPTKCIGIIPTQWMTTRALGLGILMPQLEL
jgi:hypothetical protein